MNKVDYVDVYKKLKQWHEAPPHRREFFEQLILGDILSMERKGIPIHLAKTITRPVLYIPGAICTLEQLDSEYRLRLLSNN